MSCDTELCSKHKERKKFLEVKFFNSLYFAYRNTCSISDTEDRGMRCWNFGKFGSNIYHSNLEGPSKISYTLVGTNKRKVKKKKVELSFKKCFIITFSNNIALSTY